MQFLHSSFFLRPKYFSSPQIFFFVPNIFLRSPNLEAAIAADVLRRPTRREALVAVCDNMGGKNSGRRPKAVVAANEEKLRHSNAKAAMAMARMLAPTPENVASPG